MLAFNAEGPVGLLTGKAPGQTPLLSDEHRRALAAIIDQGPTPAVDGVVRWRLKDLAAGPRGSRPSAPLDQRTKSAWLFGAICPAEGKAAGLVLPKCNTAAMSLHLAEISQAVAPGAHAVVMLDQAGWHQSKKIKMPDNITLLPLPPKCPELNQTENIWQYMCGN